jgi:DNA repair protein RecN (Recombination protein N)
LLVSLYIKNYALIDEFRVEFGSGLNIITGETGAGKSIILGAFGLLIGERASAEVIRKGADKAIVEAEFEIGKNTELRDFLKGEEIVGDSLIIRREVSAKGTSRGFVNDSPASTQLLKLLGEHLVDLHGQHEHQSLLHVSKHIDMLDDFGGLKQDRKQYREKREHVLKLSSEISELRGREHRLREERDLFEFQLQEILAVDPEPNEDIKLESQLRVLENAESLTSAATEIHDTFYDEEGSVYEQLSATKEQLSKLASIDSKLQEPLNEINSAIASINEVIAWSARYSEQIELDPQELDALRSRAMQIQRIKKKFGGSLDAVLQKKAELESKLAFTEEFEEIIAEKERELTGRLDELAKIASKLSAARKSAALKLQKGIVGGLAELGIEHGKFEVAITERPARETSAIKLTCADKSLDANSNGVDDVEFYISTNAGEEPKPLARVASGGEISRVMLAIKSVVATSDPVDLLIFDEIDIGISGRVAQKVGRAMKALAAEHQVLAITHLAQIAAFGDAHYVAEKHTLKSSTTSQLRQLNDVEHVQEIARLISGDNLGTSAIENARALIEEANGPSDLNKSATRKLKVKEKVA